MNSTPKIVEDLERRPFLEASLEGTHSLRIDRGTILFSVKKIIDPDIRHTFRTDSKREVTRKFTSEHFQLAEVSRDQLLAYRKSGIPSFVLKTNGKLFWAKVPENLPIKKTPLGTHLCIHLKNECKRLSIMSDDNGGCAKVRDRIKHIENYPWITEGYESFNTITDVFVVLKCEHYVSNMSECKARRKKVNV